MQKKRILFFGNAPWCRGGYGNNMRNLILPISKIHDVMVQCNWGLFDGEIEWKGVKCFPSEVMQGANAFELNKASFKQAERTYRSCDADLMIILNDIWPYSGVLEETDVSYIPYVPIDGYPPSCFLISALSKAKKIVTMCEWAKKILQDEHEIQSTFIPHGIDPGIYYSGEKTGIRDKLGLPQEAFIFLMVADNKGDRKAFPETMEAFANFCLNNPKSEALLYIHTNPTSPSGFNLLNLAQLFGIVDKVIFSKNMALPDKEVGDLYRASDVLLNCSKGEGFGRAIIEAAACGVPAIVTDFTSMTELVSGGRGLKVRVAAKQCQSFNNTYHAIPYIQDITENMEAYYFDRDLLARHGKKAREIAVELYDWEKLIPQWLKVIE